MQHNIFRKFSLGNTKSLDYSSFCTFNNNTAYLQFTYMRIYLGAFWPYLY